MNRRMLFLTLAAGSGLAAQTINSRLTATVPFPFDLQGNAMAAGRYEVIRTPMANTLTVRNLTTGETVQMFASYTNQVRDAANGLLFDKAGGGYSFRAIVDARTSLTYNLSPTRKQMEQARSLPAERVYIAAR